MKIPSEAGWYWARWLDKAIGTKDSQFPPCGCWEVVHVIEAAIDSNGDVQLGVLVVGVENLQLLQDFEWNDRVIFSDA